MSESKGKSDNKNVVIIAAIVAAVVLIGGYLYTQQNQSQTATLSIGDKSISATISE